MCKYGINEGVPCSIMIREAGDTNTTPIGFTHSKISPSVLAGITAGVVEGCGLSGCNTFEAGKTLVLHSVLNQMAFLVLESGETGNIIAMTRGRNTDEFNIIMEWDVAVERDEKTHNSKTVPIMTVTAYRPGPGGVFPRTPEEHNEWCRGVLKARYTDDRGVVIEQAKGWLGSKELKREMWDDLDESLR